jgi:hypothetical protein
MYVALAEKRGLDKAKLSGTTQADILKEYMAQKEYIFPIAPSVRIVDNVEIAGDSYRIMVREIEAGPGMPGLKGRTDLFIDDIHLSDQGLYLVALTHYAVIHQRSPEGLPHALLRADNTPAVAPDPEVAALMQRIVWDVVQAISRPGVPRS